MSCKNPNKRSLMSFGAIGAVEMKSVVPEMDKYGAVRQRVVVEKVPLEKINEDMSAVRCEDYTLENLLKAGVPLDRINTQNLIHSNDKSKIAEKLESLTSDAWIKLQQADWQSVMENNTSKSVENEN